MKYDDSHGEPHYHGVARLIGTKLTEIDQIAENKFVK